MSTAWQLFEEYADKHYWTHNEYYAARYAWIASASINNPNGEVVVTRDSSGEIVAVTRQDEAGRILSVIAEKFTRGGKGE